MMQKKLLVSLCVVGLLIAFTALYYHYDDSGNKFCDVSDKLNCTTVYQSEWSEWFGIPVPILGIFGYLSFGLLVWFRKKWVDALGFTDKDSWGYLALYAGVMFLFQTFMTGLEVVGIIPAFCILCLVSQIAITIIAFVAVKNWLQA